MPRTKKRTSKKKTRRARPRGFRRNMPLEASLLWMKDFVARFSAEFQYLYEFYQGFDILSNNRLRGALAEAKEAAKRMDKAKKLEAIHRFKDALDEYEEAWALLDEGLMMMNKEATRERYLTS